MPARPVLAAVVALLVSAAAAPAATVHTIRTNSDGWITRIGPLRTRAEAPTLAKATAAFGMPSSLDPVGDGADACVIEWRPLRLRTTFSNFGVGDACDEGVLQAATVRSRRFRTRRGLRVGDRSSTITEKHPNAVFRDNVWWITSAVSPFGDEERIATIAAIVQRGRVTILRLWVGAAGD